jgi:uncharacterized membrane protein (DUF485 family)
MDGQRYKSKELRRKSEELALIERLVFLVLAVVLALTSVVSQLLGAHGLPPTTTGIGAGLSALGGYLRR